MVQEFVKLLAFIVPISGELSWVFSCVGHCLDCESQRFFTLLYILLLKGFNHMLKDFIPCGDSTCRFCTEVCRIRKFPEIVKFLLHRPTPTPFGVDMMQLTQIPWNVGTGDPGYGFQNFARKFLGIDSNDYFSHFGTSELNMCITPKFIMQTIERVNFANISKLTNQGVATEWLKQSLSIPYATRARTNQAQTGQRRHGPAPLRVAKQKFRYLICISL